MISCKINTGEKLLPSNNISIHYVREEKLWSERSLSPEIFKKYSKVLGWQTEIDGWLWTRRMLKPVYTIVTFYSYYLCKIYQKSYTLLRLIKKVILLYLFTKRYSIKYKSFVLNSGDIVFEILILCTGNVS